MVKVLKKIISVIYLWIEVVYDIVLLKKDVLDLSYALFYVSQFKYDYYDMAFQQQLFCLISTHMILTLSNRGYRDDNSRKEGKTKVNMKKYSKNKN